MYGVRKYTHLRMIKRFGKLMSNAKIQPITVLMSNKPNVYLMMLMQWRE